MDFHPYKLYTQTMHANVFGFEAAEGCYDWRGLSDVTVSGALIGQIFPQNGRVYFYLANESLGRCDVRQVLSIIAIFCRFEPKKRLYFWKILEFPVVSRRNNTSQSL